MTAHWNACEVPGCDQEAVDVMIVLSFPISSFRACSAHVAEFDTPVEPAPPRSDQERQA